MGVRGGLRVRECVGAGLAVAMVGVRVCGSSECVFGGPMQCLRTLPEPQSWWWVEVVTSTLL